ncbi:MAG: hypothetical protein HQM08_27230 [Candidatus Riflebacteria bacterium]|nr:hypothetical protein [Candidatus Riflebacteria bacterium]
MIPGKKSFFLTTSQLAKMWKVNSNSEKTSELAVINPQFFRAPPKLTPARLLEATNSPKIDLTIESTPFFPLKRNNSTAAI